MACRQPWLYSLAYVLAFASLQYKSLRKCLFLLIASPRAARLHVIRNSRHPLHTRCHSHFCHETRLCNRKYHIKFLKDVLCGSGMPQLDWQIHPNEDVSKRHTHNVLTWMSHREVNSEIRVNSLLPLHGELISWSHKQVTASSRCEMETHGGLTARSQCEIVSWVSCVVDEWFQNELAVSFKFSHELAMF